MNKFPSIKIPYNRFLNGQCELYIAHCDYNYNVLRGNALINTPRDERYICIFCHNMYHGCVEPYDDVDLDHIHLLHRKIQKAIESLTNPID